MRTNETEELPIGKALIEARRKLPGWARAVLSRDVYLLPEAEAGRGLPKAVARMIEKREASITDVRRLYSWAATQKANGQPTGLGALGSFVASIVAKENNTELLNAALDCAGRTLPGWAAATLRAYYEKPAGASVQFVVAKIEEGGGLLEGEALALLDGGYLPLLGNPPHEVILIGDFERRPGAVVIALGKVCKTLLGDRADFQLPHPRALLKFGDRGEVARKANEIRKTIDAASFLVLRSEEQPTPSDGDQVVSGADSGEPSKPLNVPIVKAQAGKQIVCGVVLQPWQPGGDSQGDILSPGTFEDAAHKWMATSRVIGVNHQEQAEGAHPVESYLVPYPSGDDYRAAIKGEPHKAYRFKMGAETVTSGSWILSTKLSPKLWKAYEAGEIAAYSIGGYGRREAHDPASIPKIDWRETDGN